MAKGDADETAISVEIPSCAVTLRWQAPLPLFESKRNIRRLVLFRIKLTPETLMASSTEAVSTPAIADIRC